MKTILAGMLLIALAMAYEAARPADLGVEALAGVHGGPAARVDLAVPLRPWLRVEGGLLAAGGTAIADITPMVRIGSPWYVEGGIGVSLASCTYCGGRQQASAFNFHDVAGAGRTFGDWGAGLRYNHYSNADLKKPNNGYDWAGLYIERRFK